MSNFELIDIPKIYDSRGSISVIEKNTIPFDIKRVYYLYDVPSDSYRGGHAHKNQIELLVPVSGSFDVMMDNGLKKEVVTLNKPNIGLLIKQKTWRELQNFSSGSVCLVLASDIFCEDDYIRDYNEFQEFINSQV